MIKETLKNIDFFKSLNEKQIQRLIDISIFQSFDKEYILFHKGDKSDYIYVLIEGVVKIYKHDNVGNQIIIGIFNGPSLLGEAASLKQISFPSTASCHTNTKILKINTYIFLNEFLCDINIAKQIINSLLGKIQLLQQNIHNNIASTAREKIFNFYNKNEDFTKDLKHYEIAALLSITPETFSRNLKQLIKEKKLIKYGKNYKINPF